MTLQTEWLALLTMFGSGLILGVCLDVYRVLKGRWEMTGWVVALVDLCYWIVAAGWVFSVLLWSTWGELRFYMLLILFVGVGLYYLWLSRPTISVILFVIRVVQALLHFVIQCLHILIVTPLIFLAKFVWTLIKLVGRVIFVILRGVAWMLSPLWRPLEHLLRPVYMPLNPFLLKSFRRAAGVWQKMKNVLRRKDKSE